MATSGTPPFERPLKTYKEIYDDDIEEMKNHLPDLANQCCRLGETDLGKHYAQLRLASFILESNKLEGTLTAGESDGETFKVILGCLKSHHEDGGQVHLIPWDEEGQNFTDDAWYSQCKAHLEALTMMEKLANESTDLNPDLLLECHHLLMRGAKVAGGASFESRFRGFDEPVLAGNYVFPNHTDHKADLAQALSDLNAEFGSSHPVAWASDLMLTILTHHLFLNGNGRMAHLCFAYGLMRHGVPFAVVFSDWHSKDRSHYIRAIQDAQAQRGQKKVEKLYSMGITCLFLTLNNMLTFCHSKG